jgi:hypothetical protein
MITEKDLESVIAYMDWLKTGAIEHDTPLVFEQGFDDKIKRAEFHQLFKDKIPQYISDTIVSNENRNASGQTRQM